SVSWVSLVLTLLRSEDDEPDSGGRDRRQGLVVNGTLWEPHSQRTASEAIFEIDDSPRDLQLKIARRQQRQNRMVVGLRDRVAVATKPIARQRVAPQHRPIGGLAVISQPQGQRGARVEVDRFVIVADMDDGAFHRVRMSIGGVALAQDALIPVGE